MWDSDLVSCRGLAIGLVLSRAASLIFPIVQDVFVCRVIEQFWRVYTHMCLILYFKYIYMYICMFILYQHVYTYWVAMQGHLGWYLHFLRCTSILHSGRFEELSHPFFGEQRTPNWPPQITGFSSEEWPLFCVGCVRCIR